MRGARFRARIRGRFRGAHGPTWLVAVGVYGGWLALTLGHAALPLPVLAALGGLVIAWHGSLQHETIHGHPAGPRVLGYLLGAPPLSLWLPYEVYRATHRAHHATLRLTDPDADPESQLWTREARLRAGPVMRAVRTLHLTAAGRLTLGPLIVIASFVRGEARALLRGEPGRRRAWALHVVHVAVALLFVTRVAGMPLATYLACFVYPGASLTLLRSLAEHRADVDPERRTAVVEAGALMSLLFLHNNLHVMHHRAPHVPWFALPARWRRARAGTLAAGRIMVHRDGYAGLVRRHALRAVGGEAAP